MSSHSHVNPTDRQMQGAGEMIGTVVSIGLGEKDESKQDGRVQVQLTPQHESGVQTGQLVWCTVRQSPQDGGFRNVGDSVGHGLTPGSTVTLKPFGQQSYMVTGVVSSQSPNDDERDLDPRLSKKDRKVKRDDLEKQYAQMGGQPYAPDANQARKANFGTLKFKHQGGDPIKDIGERIEQAKRFGNKRGLRSIIDKFAPGSIAGFPKQAADPLKAIKAIQKHIGTKGEIIPSAFKMQEQLKAFAKSGSLTDATNMVGGAQNLISGLQGIASMVSAGGGKSTEVEDLLTILCRLYKELTGLECRLDGELTEEFEKWRVEYLEQFGGV